MGWWGGGVVGWWDGGVVGWWSGGMVGLWGGEVVGGGLSRSLYKGLSTRRDQGTRQTLK